MKREVKKAKYVSYEKRLALRIISSILIFMFFILCPIKSIKINQDKRIKYNQTSKINYKVNLKDNSYYTDNTLNEDMLYISGLVDTIDVNFDYNFNVSENVNYNYSYDVNADIEITDKNSNSKIFTKREKILEEKINEMINSNGFSLNKKININYQKYNDIVKNFKSDYTISANSNLHVALIVKITDENGNPLNADNKMDIIIPLAEQMVNIKLDYKEINNKDTVKVHRSIIIDNKVLFITALILFLINFILIINIIKYLRKVSYKKSLYEITLAKILREYDRIIVEVNKNYKMKDKDIIHVKSFEELLDVRDNLEKPIIFYEIHRGMKAIFFVINNNEVYQYILKKVDME